MSEKEGLGLIDRFIAAMQENQRENRETISQMGQPFGREAFDFASGFGGGAMGAIKRLGGAVPRLVDLGKTSGMTPRRLFAVVDETGETIVKLETKVSGKRLSIEDITVGREVTKRVGRGGNKFRSKNPGARETAQSIGQSALREVLPDLVRRHPGVESIGGVRVTGARELSGKITTITKKIPKRVQKQVEAPSRRDQSSRELMQLDELVRKLNRKR